MSPMDVEYRCVCRPLQGQVAKRDVLLYVLCMYVCMHNVYVCMYILFMYVCIIFMYVLFGPSSYC